MPKSTIALESPASARRYKFARLGSAGAAVSSAGRIGVGLGFSAAGGLGDLGMSRRVPSTGSGSMGCVWGACVPSAGSGLAEGWASLPRFPPVCAPEGGPIGTGGGVGAGWTIAMFEGLGLRCAGLNPQYKIGAKISTAPAATRALVFLKDFEAASFSYLCAATTDAGRRTCRSVSTGLMLGACGGLAAKASDSGRVPGRVWSFGS